MPTLPLPVNRQAPRTIASLLALGALAACVRTPPESPAPARPGEPATASVPSPVPGARRWSIVRTPATSAWLVETVARVDVTADTSRSQTAATPAAPAPGDSAAAATPPAQGAVATAALASSDSVRSQASFVVTLADAAGGLALTGTLDSLVVLSPRAPARRPILAPVPVAGLLDTVARRLTITGEADSSAACADPSRGAALLVRELVVALPRVLEAGQRWSDSSTTATCRAGVPVTSRTTYEYAVLGIEERGGVAALAVRRTMRATLAGGATLRGSLVSLAGESTGEATLSVDPRDGRLHASSGTSTTRLTITTDGSSRDVTQSATTRVTLQPR